MRPRTRRSPCSSSKAGAWTAELAPDGARVATASNDGIARIWDVSPAAPRVLQLRDRTHDGAFSPDGAQIATVSESHGLQLWTAAGAPVASWPGRPGLARVVFSPDGRRIGAMQWTQQALILDLASGAAVELDEPGAPLDPELRFGHWPAAMAFSPDGRRFATAGTERGARIWDAASGRPVTPPLLHAARVTAVRFTPDGRRLITASLDGTARTWDAATGAPAGAPLVHPAGTQLTSAEVGPGGARIAAVSAGFVQLWDAARREPGPRLEHASWIVAAAFSPDGARLLTFSIDQSARLWDAATGSPAAPPLEHASPVESAAFSADGARLVTVADRAARVWDAATGLPLTVPLVHGAIVRHAAFSPDGRALLTVALDGIRLWDVSGDERSLDEWRQIAERGAFPQLVRALDALRAR